MTLHDIVAEIQIVLTALSRYDTDAALTRLERLQLDIEIEQRRQEPVDPRRI